jgi:hypothetical protein
MSGHSADFYIPLIRAILHTKCNVPLHLPVRYASHVFSMMPEKCGIIGSVEIPDHTFEIGAMLNRFSTDVAKGDVCYPQRMADS